MRHLNLTASASYLRHCPFCPVLCGCVLITLFFSCRNEVEETYSPYIAKVFSYNPAPGQFINELPPYADSENILTAVEEILVGSATRGLVTLGAWGGNIVVGFDHPIENRPGIADFKIYGNAYPGSCEPGIVWVAADTNRNGLPDDEWYELAGPAYHSDSTVHSYRCVYYRPDPIDGDVFWRDNLGEEGYVRRNSYHDQTSYYPLWEKADSLVFEGEKLPSNAYMRGTDYVTPGFAWGYADNRPNTSSAADFDIAWAVDAKGNAVTLTEIDFIRICTGQQQQLGHLGETSTELAGILNLGMK